MQDNILAELEETRRRLISVFSAFEQEQVNISPNEGSWTAAQVAVHILKSLKGALKTINGPVKETNREPRGKVALIKNIFLDFTTKYTAPEFLIPTNLSQDRDTLVDSLNTKMKEIADAVPVVNLAETCTGFELPGAGAMSRVEWFYFVIYHTQRHTQQLDNIHSQIAAA